MDCKSLMLGDWVEFQGEYYRIATLKKSGVIELQYSDGTLVDLTTSRIENVIKPIPLTPKILELNGWRCYKTISSSNWALGGLYIDGNCGCYKMFIGSNNNTIKLNYVHQLQHLLRACGYDDLADNFLVR